jgi:HD-GYP domain-containing protein (c-di-GMP phosphodiesterase class II)
VLEKPARLTDEEYVYIQNHAWYSYQILSQVRGFEDVCRWASFHHEKLDGTGYPFGKMGYELNGLERLMGCIDIYQALVEDRPYKAGYDHAKAIGIMRSMACSNKIDGSIVSDVDERFGPRQVLVGTRPLV